MSKRDSKGKFTEGNTEGFAGNPENINKNGRPKKAYKRFAEKYNLTEYNRSEIKDAYATVAAMSSEQVKEVLNDPNSDILIQTVCRSFEKAKAKGDFKSVKDIVEMISGKAITQIAEVDTDGNDLFEKGLILSVKKEVKEAKTNESDIGEDGQKNSRTS